MSSQVQHDETPSRSSYSSGYQDSPGVSEDNARDLNQDCFPLRESTAPGQYTGTRGRFSNPVSSFSEPPPRESVRGDAWIQGAERNQSRQDSWNHPSKGLRNDERTDRYDYKSKSGGATAHDARSSIQTNGLPSTMPQRTFPSPYFSSLALVLASCSSRGGGRCLPQESYEASGTKLNSRIRPSLSTRNHGRNWISCSSPVPCFLTHRAQVADGSKSSVGSSQQATAQLSFDRRDFSWAHVRLSSPTHTKRWPLS